MDYIIFLEIISWLVFNNKHEDTINDKPVISAWFSMGTKKECPEQQANGEKVQTNL